METTQLIEGFKDRFDKFVALYKKCKLENNVLKLELEKLNSILEQKNNEILLLKDELNKNKIAKSFLVSGVNPKDAKLQINRIVREIDNCIALLNR